LARIIQSPNRGEKIIDQNGVATQKFRSFLLTIDSQETTNNTEQSIQEAIGNTYSQGPVRAFFSRPSVIGDIEPNDGNFLALTATTIDGTAVTSTMLIKSVLDSVTAGTTQTQAGATALTADINRVSVCGNAGDVVGLPSALAGRSCKVINDGANNAQVFPKTSGDNIDSQAANAVDPNALLSGSSREYACLTAGTWRTA